LSRTPLLSPDDEAYLERARRLAHRGWGHAHPNPMVGCVLVREGAVVGEGFHRTFGGPHAEIVALEEALGASDGATAYVSLEPCNHHGKTPPCADALRAAGVRRVVYGARDPGQVSGGGGAALRAAGLEVAGPIWSEEIARAENPEFFHSARHTTPFVALKLAMSLDARIASAPGRRTRITGVEAEREVHRLRSGFDAVMVGAGTVGADDPRLTSRLVPEGREPTRRVVLAPGAEIRMEAALFQDVERVPLHVFCRQDAPQSAVERLERAGADVHPVPDAGGQDHLDLDAVLLACREVGIRSVLCEGGRELAGSLLAERRVNRLYLFVSPVTLGEAGLAAFPADAQTLEWNDFRRTMEPKGFGPDTLIVLDRQEP
jgi:diaminohydroxyphosphoribosylaminopyrimidine deaminase / 5-amino-6-(5-phosphoribosylamino)uracil reductase